MRGEGTFQWFQLSGRVLLQFLNPKGILYGFTIYVSFSPILTGSIPKMARSAFFLSVIAFLAVSTWALAGSALSRWFENPRFHLPFNIVRVLLLGYSVSLLLASHRVPETPRDPCRMATNSTEAKEPEGVPP